LQGSESANTYNASQTITHFSNEARYPTTGEADIEAKMQTLIAASRIVYKQINSTQAIQTLDITDTAALNVFLNPITASSINPKPTDHRNENPLQHCLHHHRHNLTIFLHNSYQRNQ
jgi:hypothetical protein